MKNTEHNLILLGAPGAGKGTQARRLVAELGTPHISTGDILRAKRKEETPLAQRINELMASGQLVSDDIVIEIIEERLRNDDTQEGFILDGFPRTVGQAEALDSMLARLGRSIHHVVLVDVSDKLLIERLAGRRICRKCGREYNTEFKPPRQVGLCDECDGELYQREDDSLDTVRRRLVEYTDKTSPLIDYYQRKGLLRRVDGTGEMDAVTARVTRLLQA